MILFVRPALFKMAADDTDWLYNDDIDVPVSSEVRLIVHSGPTV